MGFNDATRRKITTLPPQTRSSGATLRWDIPRVGLLARVWVTVRGTINTVTSGPNALGMSSILKRIRLSVNSGPDVFNVTGPGYAYLVRPYLDFPADPFPQDTSRSAVATDASVVLDFVIPVMVNLRDPLGLLMLQNEQTLATLTIDCETDAIIATGGITWTTQPVITPYLEIFTVPATVADWPPLNMIHQIIEDSTSVAAAGQFTYQWPRGNVYMSMVHGLGMGVSGSDGWTSASLRVNQSDYIHADVAPTFYDLINPMLRAQQRLSGVLPFDLMSTTGLGVYDLMRDTIDSRNVTDLATVITASGAGTLYSVRRQLVPLLG